MEMTIDETIKRFQSNAEYERTHDNLQGCLEFRQLAEWLRKYQKIEQIMKKRYGRYYIEIVQEIKEVIEDGNDK